MRIDQRLWRDAAWCERLEDLEQGELAVPIEQTLENAAVRRPALHTHGERGVRSFAQPKERVAFVTRLDLGQDLFVCNGCGLRPRGLVELRRHRNLDPEPGGFVGFGRGSALV